MWHLCKAASSDASAEPCGFEFKGMSSTTLHRAGHAPVGHWDQRYGSIHGARNFLAALRMASFVSLDWESAYCLIPAASLPGLQVSSISPLLFCHPGLGCRPNQICSPLVPCCVQHILWPAYFSCPAHSSRLPTAAPSCIYNTSSPTSNHLHPLWHTHDHWNSTGFQSLQDELRLGKK